jgi:hypothetical protein
LIAFDAEDGAGDLLANHDRLANAAREDKHVVSLMSSFRREHGTPNHELGVFGFLITELESRHLATARRR